MMTGYQSKAFIDLKIHESLFSCMSWVWDHQNNEKAGIFLIMRNIKFEKAKAYPQKVTNPTSVAPIYEN